MTKYHLRVLNEWGSAAMCYDTADVNAVIEASTRALIRSIRDQYSHGEFPVPDDAIVEVLADRTVRQINELEAELNTAENLLNDALNGTLNADLREQIEDFLNRNEMEPSA